MSGTTVGVLDIGRAWLKASVWDQDPARPPIWRDQDKTDLLKLDVVVRDFLTELRRRSDVVISYGASLFRDDPEVRDAVGRTAVGLSDLAVQLSGRDEGLLLLSSASREQADVLLDVGGGSIQLVWHQDGAAVVRSWPFGTYALEKTYDLTQGSPTERYDQVFDVITREVEQAAEPRGRRLLVGSNVMADFFAAVAPHVGQTGDDWQVPDLHRARAFCASLDQQRFGEVFPQNPGFMFGGDKAMLVAEAVAAALSAHANPTNASVSHGMAIEAREALAGTGLESLPYERLTGSS
jgi:hypothetical protein